MNLKEQLKSLNKDYELRSYLFSGFSLFTTFVFLIYNLVLGIVYSAIWNFSISFYYLILLTLRTIIITKEKHGDTMKSVLGTRRDLSYFDLQLKFCWLWI